MRTRERLANVHGLTVARAAGTPGAFGSQRRYPPQSKPAPAVDVRRREGARRREAVTGAAAEARDQGCTGVSAGWCPRCGDCTCPDRERAMDSPTCPLHSADSRHADEEGA